MVINLGVSCNFYISIDLVYPRFCDSGSIVVAEVRGIPSPQILKPIFHNEFGQGIIGTTSTNSLF